VNLVTIHADRYIEEKKTTQRAPLEKFLNFWRTKKIVPFVADKITLDFGCGASLRTLRAIGGMTKSRYGIDSHFKNDEPHTTTDGINVVGSFTDLSAMLAARKESVDVIISLACFEHLETADLRVVLSELRKISKDGAVIVGTVPRPPAKPVLEFLSYKLRLIDPTQIEDHKVYYDKSMLRSALEGTGWQLEHYQTFQLGMNSFFRMVKR
jgi:2-polyprenyl-3-methyl-5-hydroxy-6-metoxy-1,4-benzoquinol methylase